MNLERLAEILSRVTAMEEGQRHNTAVLQDITQRVGRMDDKLHAVIFGEGDKPGIITKVDRLERAMDAQERRMQPWRQGLTILAAALLGGFFAWVAAEAMHVEQRIYLQEHQKGPP